MSPSQPDAPSQLVICAAGNYSVTDIQRAIIDNHNASVQGIIIINSTLCFSVLLEEYNVYFIPESVTPARLINTLRKPSGSLAKNRHRGLTAQELLIIDTFKQAKTVSAVSRRLGFSIKTVSNRKISIMNKLALDNNIAFMKFINAYSPRLTR